MNNIPNNIPGMLQNMMAQAVEAKNVEARGQQAIESVQADFQSLDIGNVNVHRVLVQHNDSGNTTTMDVVDAHKFAEVAAYASKAGEMLCLSLGVNITSHADKSRLEQALMAIEALLEVTQDAETGRAIQLVIDMAREAIS